MQGPRTNILKEVQSSLIQNKQNNGGQMINSEIVCYVNPNEKLSRTRTQLNTGNKASNT